ncbi:MIP family channel protein [Selenomonadales bacterium OttesenSCG-928-I06]|nr:MIP family channel protein [Selenomonadales bacterium OttesenSCG-928-I06]
MKKYIAEFIGTFTLVFMGCGSAIFLGCDINGGHLAVAFAFGLSIVSMAYVIGNISGCHINPAVSFAMLLQKRMSSSDFIGYIIAQILGAIVAATILHSIVYGFHLIDYTGGLGSNGVAGAGGVWGALIVEIILTFIFVFTILGVTSDESKSSVAGLIIGFTLTFVHIVGIPLTGTSVNPARSIGPAIFAGAEALAPLWVFIVGPLVGALIASLLFSLLKPNVAK